MRITGLGIRSTENKLYNPYHVHLVQSDANGKRTILPVILNGIAHTHSCDESNLSTHSFDHFHKIKTKKRSGFE